MEGVFVGLVVNVLGVGDVCGCGRCTGVVCFGWDCGTSGGAMGAVIVGVVVVMGCRWGSWKVCL